MCGIIAYVGNRKAVDVLIDGLKKLQYRGYDSAGIAILRDHEAFQLYKRGGKLQNLLNILPAHNLIGDVGIGHTRWATHGGVSDENAHPHLSFQKKIAVVHNGIFENYLDVKKQLEQVGNKFSGQTDTEVFAHWVEKNYNEMLTVNSSNSSISVSSNSSTITAHEILADSVRKSLREMKGSYSVAVALEGAEVIVGARTVSPLVVGIGENENFLASDPSVLSNYTKKFIFLNEGDVAIVTKKSVVITDLYGNVVNRHIEEISEFQDDSKLIAGEFPYHMLREIYEQPEVISKIMKSNTNNEGEFTYKSNIDPSGIERVHLVACGTSYHAALYGQYAIEELARIHASTETASEFRYRDPVLDRNTLVIFISQSGETTDTLEALRHAKRKGVRSLGIINVPGSAISRETDDNFYLQAGKEIGVASTKAFMGMLIALSIISIWLGKSSGKLQAPQVGEIIREMHKLPELCRAVLAQHSTIKKVSRKYTSAKNVYFFGRGNQYPVALEGSLKLKEISYIHAEGYPAGELKHGPIALIDKSMPTVAIATQHAMYEKVASNIQEIKARNGQVVAIATDGNEKIKSFTDDVIYVPDVCKLFEPVLTIIPLQLLAYEIAVQLGRDVDQPRNLAKSVTVE
jgi:glucosamine--fructose-6-phosphate aminotransferase (isomerizing)